MNECCKKKQRNEAERKTLINRINRIEGQIKGIKGMIEEDRYCIDILTQISAAKAALSALNKEILNEHINTCVVDGVKNGNQAIIKELCDTVDKYIK